MYSNEERQAIINRVCERIASGESLRKICETTDDIPPVSTVQKWIRDSDVFHSQYARATEERANVYFDQCQEIADNSTPETVAVARLQIDTRKWMAGKLRPKKYGNHIDVTTDGEKINSIDITSMILAAIPTPLLEQIHQQALIEYPDE